MTWEMRLEGVMKQEVARCREVTGWAKEALRHAAEDEEKRGDGELEVSAAGHHGSQQGSHRVRQQRHQGADVQLHFRLRVLLCY